MKAPRNAEFLLFVLLALFGVSITWKTAARDTGIDFYQFWAVGQALDRPGVTNVYSNEERSRLGAELLEQARRGENRRLASVAEYRKTLETYSTPFLYATFRTFSTGDYEADFRNYRILTLACLAVTVILLARLAGHPWTTTLGATALFSTWFPPFSSDLRVGNVNSLQLATLALYLLLVTRARFRLRDAAGGAVLGLAIAFKPNLVFVAGALALAWLADGRRRRLAHHAVGGAAALLAAVLFAALRFGSPRCWTDWISAIGSLPGGIITVDLGNFAPARLLAETFGFDPAPALGVLFSGALAAVLIRTRRGADRTAGGETGDGLVLAAGCLLAVLATRLAWLHYFVFTIPALIYLLRPMEADGGASILWRRALPAIAVVALAIEPIQNIGVGITARVAAVLLGLAGVALFAAVLKELALLRTRAAQP